MPQRDSGEVSAGNFDGKKSPAPGSVRGRPSVRRGVDSRTTSSFRNGADSASPVALLIASLHVHRRRSARRRASASSPASVACSRGDMNLRATPSTLTTRSPCSMSTPMRQPRGDSEDRHAARMRDVEVEVRAGNVRAAAPAAGDHDLFRRKRELAAEQEAQGRAAHDVALAKVGTAEPRRARSLRVRQCRFERGDVAARPHELAHPDVDLRPPAIASASGRAGTAMLVMGPALPCALNMLVQQPHRVPDVLGFVLGSMSRWPRRVLDGFGYVAYVVVYRIVRWRRGLSATNIANAFPEKSPAERQEILRQSYRNLGRFLAEALWGWNASADALASRVASSIRSSSPRFTANGSRWCCSPRISATGNGCCSRPARRSSVPIDAVYKPQRQRCIDEFLRDAPLALRRQSRSRTRASCSR